MSCIQCFVWLYKENSAFFLTASNIKLLWSMFLTILCNSDLALIFQLRKLWLSIGFAIYIHQMRQLSWSWILCLILLFSDAVHVSSEINISISSCLEFKVRILFCTVLVFGSSQYSAHVSWLHHALWTSYSNILSFILACHASVPVLYRTIWLHACFCFNLRKPFWRQVTHKLRLLRHWSINARLTL